MRFGSRCNYTRMVPHKKRQRPRVNRVMKTIIVWGLYDDDESPVKVKSSLTTYYSCNCLDLQSPEKVVNLPQAKKILLETFFIFNVFLRRAWSGDWGYSTSLDSLLATLPFQKFLKNCCLFPERCKVTCFYQLTITFNLINYKKLMP